MTEFRQNTINIVNIELNNFSQVELTQSKMYELTRQDVKVTLHKNNSFHNFIYFPRLNTAIVYNYLWKNLQSSCLPSGEDSHNCLQNSSLDRQGELQGEGGVWPRELNPMKQQRPRTLLNVSASAPMKETQPIHTKLVQKPMQ